jgi:hypothetical protein
MERRIGDKFRQQTRKKSQFENTASVNGRIPKTHGSAFLH